MDAIEKEIRNCFERMSQPLASTEVFYGSSWFSQSQYGYALSEHESKKDAEAATIAYYRERMNLIRQ